MTTSDLSFAHMVRAAAAHMVRPTGHSATAKLAAYIRSDAPLGKGERQMLADLIEGELRPESNRGAKSKVKPAEQRKAVAEFVERTDAGENAESVANEIYNRLNVRRSTFFQWVADIRPVIIELEAMGLPGTDIMKSS